MRKIESVIQDPYGNAPQRGTGWADDEVTFVHQFDRLSGRAIRLAACPKDFKTSGAPVKRDY